MDKKSIPEMNKDFLTKKNQELQEKLNELEIRIQALEPDNKNDFNTELTEKQINGLNTDIFDCGFSRRVLVCLKCQMFHDRETVTLKDVATIKMHILKRVRNIGKYSVQEIVNKLAEFDLTTDMEILCSNGKYYKK